MGLYAHNDSLYMACRYQPWQLENRLTAEKTHQGGDRLYVPSVAYTTGDLNVHDVVMAKNQQLLFINTDFSCLAKLSISNRNIGSWKSATLGSTGFGKFWCAMKNCHGAIWTY